MQSKHHIYNLSLQWTGNKGTGTNGYRTYDRSYTISAANKPEIYGSSDPAFLGDRTKYNPEELFLASLSSCHMLWYLHLCADAGIVVLAYLDEAKGTMAESPDGAGRFTQVTLNPVVTLADPSMVEKANRLHEEADKKCFIANSVNFPVLHNPSWQTTYQC